MTLPATPAQTIASMISQNPSLGQGSLQATLTIDQNGNNVLSLHEIGLPGSFARYRQYDKLYLSELDIVMALTGQDNNCAGNI